ncbi:hypothetical protein BJY04DRAFT_191847 [Aspergillus karnatakaensis]|uniref:uncharacterized protein n=1 Tax=Aspergillus karnatakaensis TaxID=1810916 RepID=UPI003CCCB7E4
MVAMASIASLLKELLLWVRAMESSDQPTYGGWACPSSKWETGGTRHSGSVDQSYPNCVAMRSKGTARSGCTIDENTVRSGAGMSPHICVQSA